MVNKKPEDKSITKTIEIFSKTSRVNCTVTMNNPGPKIVKVKKIDIIHSSLRDVNGQLLKEASCFVRLRPGQTQRCILNMELYPCLPPGQYSGEFICGDILKQPFVLYVSKRIELALFPKSIIIKSNASLQLSRELVISNKGNVPISLNREIAVPLTESDIMTRTFDSAVVDAGHDGFMKVMDVFMKNLQEAIPKPMIISFENENLELSPCETRTFTINLTLPDNLNSNRRYSGKINLCGSVLSFKFLNLCHAFEHPQIK